MSRSRRLLRRTRSLAEATAVQLEGDTPNARRVRAHRERLANGLGIYRLQLSTVDLEVMLRREDPLGLDPTHEQVEQALVSFLNRLIELSSGPIER